MEILGIGVPELAFILVIALILLGPKDMIAAGRTFGKTLRKIITSPTWKAVRTTGQELQQLPTRLMREAGLDDEFKNIEKEVRDATRFSIDPRQVAPRFNEEPLADATDVPSAEQDPGSDSSPEDPQA